MSVSAAVFVVMLFGQMVLITLFFWLREGGD